MISARRITVVHVAVKQLGFDDATYLREHGGVETARDLDFLGFDRLMKHFAACGFRSIWTERSYGNRPGTRIETVSDVPVSVQNEWAGTSKPIATAWLK